MALRKIKKNSAAIALPSVRTYRVWTPRQIRSAEISADNGNLRMAADLCDWLLADDRVRGSLEGRVNGFMELPISFEGEDERLSETLGDKDWDVSFPSDQTKLINYWALLLGIGPGVLRWDRPPGHDGRDVPSIEFYHPQQFRYDWQNRSWTVDTNQTRVEFGDGIWVGHMPFGSYRPWSLGLWRSLSRWALLKAYAISDYGRLGESATRNIATSDKESGSTQQDRIDLAAALSKMGREGFAVLPPGYDYKLVEASAGVSEIYNKQIELANTAISIAIRGNNLTTEVKGGSLAASKTHEKGDLSNRRNDAGAWSTTTHDQMIAHWAQSNYGDATKAPWPKYATEPEEDRKVKASTMVQALIGAEKAEALGFKVDRKAFADSFGLSDFIDPGTVSVLETVENEPSDSKAMASARRATLASGDEVGADGFIQGIEYSDLVADKATPIGAKGFAEYLSGAISALNESHSIEGVRSRMLRYYETSQPTAMADTLEKSSIMTHLSGLWAVVQDVPNIKAFAKGLPARAELVGPKKAPTTPHKFDEAVDWFNRRVIVSPEEFDAISDLAKAEAFTVGGVAQMNVIQDVLNQLERAIERGESIDAFRKRMSERLTKAWGGENPSRIDLIFRNATARAHSAGRLEQLSQPSLTAILAYRLYDAVRDGNTTPICINLDGTILPFDHPIWPRIWPQNHHACRSGVRAITGRDAKKRGISKGPFTDPADGFTASPTDISSLMPDESKLDAEIFRLAKVKKVAA